MLLFILGTMNTKFYSPQVGKGQDPFHLACWLHCRTISYSAKETTPPPSPPHTPAPHPCPYGIAFYKIYGVHFLHWLSPCCWSQILIARHTHPAFPNSSSKICFCFRCVRIFVFLDSSFWSGYCLKPVFYKDSKGWSVPGHSMRTNFSSDKRPLGSFLC